MTEQRRWTIYDHEETGPIGDGTPHARMKWFWDRMHQHEAVIMELVPRWSPMHGFFRFEDAIAQAFDRLVEERGQAEGRIAELERLKDVARRQADRATAYMRRAEAAEAEVERLREAIEDAFEALPDSRTKANRILLAALSTEGSEE